MPLFPRFPWRLSLVAFLSAVVAAPRAAAQEPAAPPAAAEAPAEAEPPAPEPAEPAAGEAVELDADGVAKPAVSEGEAAPEPEQAGAETSGQAEQKAIEPAASTTVPWTERPTRERPAAPEPIDRKGPGRWPQFAFGARLMTGWELETERPSSEQGGEDRTDHGFFLDQARIGLVGRPFKRVKVKLSADLADALRPAGGVDGFSSVPYLRNAYLDLRLHRALRLRAGRFKRPFSRLENRSTSSLPFRGRGLTNGLVVKDAGWGDRALGMMAWGRLREADLAWYLSVSNPDWEADRDSEDQGADLHARLVYSPARWISLGANGGHKVVKRPSGAIESFNALGGDLRVQTGGLYLAAEALTGQLPNEDGGSSAGTASLDEAMKEKLYRPFAFGSTGYASYDIAVSRRITLQPCLSGEYADANVEVSATEAIRAIAGLNLLWSGNIRIMPQVELFRPLGRVSTYNPWNAGERFTLMLKVTT
jgi:hypothetical protein